PIYLLLLAQLQAIVGSTGAGGPAVLPRLGVLGLGVERATSALQEKVGSFAAGEFRLRSGITCHFDSSILTRRGSRLVRPSGRPGARVRGRTVVFNPKCQRPPEGGPGCRAGPRYGRQIRRFCGGRQPLCGIGVTSEIDRILIPSALSARTEDSRPGPGPLICTSRFLMPQSCATRPAASAATCAANGVDLREPLNPAPPEVAQASALPWRSVIVMIVLLKDAWTCAMPSDTFFLTFFRTRWAPCEPRAIAGFSAYFFSATPARRGPLRVRAFVRVRWPRAGRPRRWRMPRLQPRSIRRLIYIETSRRSAPSTVNLPLLSRSRSRPAMVRSLNVITQ